MMIAPCQGEIQLHKLNEPKPQRCAHNDDATISEITLKQCLHSQKNGKLINLVRWPLERHRIIISLPGFYMCL